MHLLVDECFGFLDILLFVECFSAEFFVRGNSNKTSSSILVNKDIIHMNRSLLLGRIERELQE